MSVSDPLFCVIMSVQSGNAGQAVNVEPNQGELSDTPSGKANLMYISLSR